jgi:hypothetical protein
METTNDNLELLLEGHAEIIVEPMHQTAIEINNDDTISIITEMLKYKQDKNDDDLVTESKSIVGAINELKEGIDNKKCVIDNALSEESENAVQNKVITKEVNDIKNAMSEYKAISEYDIQQLFNEE